MFDMFAEQHGTFMKKYPIVIDFQENWSATLVEEQCFKIDNFIEINKIASAIHEPIGYQAINGIDEIKAIFTGIKDGESITIFIQEFNRRRAINRSKYAILFSKDSFTKLDNNVIILDSKIVGIFKTTIKDPSRGELRFTNFAAISRIFDTSDYYTEATDEQIQSFLGHKLFDSKITIDKISLAARKKIGFIMKSGILDRRNYDEIRVIAHETFKMKIETNNEKIIIPEDVVEFRKFLKFLAEDYYNGYLSDNTYYSNSKILVPKSYIKLNLGQDCI